MKKNAKLIIAFTALAIAFLAFRKYDSTVKLKTISALVTKGKWKVNIYRDNGVDETNNYTGYELHFKPNGTVVADKEGNSLSGHWKTGLSESRKSKLMIDFDAASDLDELSEDWLVVNKSAQSLELEDADTGIEGVDYLQLERIS